MTGEGPIYEVLLCKQNGSFGMELEDISGLYVVSGFVAPKRGGKPGPAHACGKIMKGDRLLAVDGADLDVDRDMAQVIRRLQLPEDSASLRLQRTSSSTAERDALVRVEWIAGQQTALFVDYKVSLRKEGASLGLELQEVALCPEKPTSADKLDRQGRQSNHAPLPRSASERVGVFIMHVVPGGAADESGVQAGDVVIGVNGHSALGRGEPLAVLAR
jgi:S1-C subfamily serine protease